MIYADKREVQGEGPFLDGVNITIRRNYIYEDAYDKLSPENGKQTYLFKYAESSFNKKRLAHRMLTFIDAGKRHERN